MDFSRPLLLKGLGGLAAVGTVGGGVVLGRNMLLKNQEGKDKVREEVNDKLKTLGLGEDCRLGKEDDPYSINKECPLNEEKLKAIKFSNKGGGDLKIVGQVPEGLKLKFERKNKEEDISFSFSGLAEGADIKVFGDESKGKVIIKNAGEGIKKFKEKEGKLEKDSSGVDAELKTKLEEFNKQLGTVNAPVECRFDEVESEDSVECGVTQDDLIKTMKFSGLGEGELTVKGGVPAEGLKLKVEKNGKEDISLSFTGVTSDIKLFGDKKKGKIVIKNAAEGIKKFKVKDGKLTKGDSDENLKTFNEQLGTINAPIECRFDEAESEESVECPISEDDLKGLKFSGLGEGKLKIVGWSGNSNVKLKVKKNSESQNEMFLSFQDITSEINVFGDKSKGKIIVKSIPESRFKVKDGKLEKEPIGVDVDLKAQLEEFNKQLEKINAPMECRLDEAESNASVECSVTPDDLKTMVFENGQGELTYSSGSDFTGMKLEVQLIVEEVDAKDSKILTFKDYDKTVKLMNNQKEIVSLIKGTNPEFEIRDEGSNSVLTKKWSPDSFKDLLDLTCTNSDGDNKWECIFNVDSEEINVGKDSGYEFEKLKIESTSGKSFELYKDEENINQGFKFVFKGEAVPATGESGFSLEPNSNYEFRWKGHEKTRIGYLVKKDSQ